MGTGGYMDVPAGEHDYDEAGTSGYVSLLATHLVLLVSRLVR